MSTSRRPSAKELVIDEKTLESFSDLVKKNIKESHENAILGKRDNPTWRILMDNYRREFSEFDAAVRGFWNIKTDEWVIIMSDAAYGHALLCDYFCRCGDMKKKNSSYLIKSVAEPINWVAFYISPRCDHINVRDMYIPDDDEDYFAEDVPSEKYDAIEYRVNAEIIPIIKKCMDEEFPYQEIPRVITNAAKYDESSDYLKRLYDSGYYDNDYQGSFTDLVYKLKGMHVSESVIDFEEWLNEDDSE